MQKYRDIIRLTSEGLFVLPRDNEERMIVAGMDAAVGADRGISPSLMSLGGKLHWGSTDTGLLWQPGTCLLPQLILTATYTPAPPLSVPVPGIPGGSAALVQLQTPVIPDRNKSIPYSWVSPVFQEMLHHHLALVNGHLESSCSICRRGGGCRI